MVVTLKLHVVQTEILGCIKWSDIFYLDHWTCLLVSASVDVIYQWSWLSPSGTLPGPSTFPFCLLILYFKSIGLLEHFLTVYSLNAAKFSLLYDVNTFSLHAILPRHDWILPDEYAIMPCRAASGGLIANKITSWYVIYKFTWYLGPNFFVWW